MSSRTELFADILREYGSSSTLPRRALFELLIGKEPLSMHELVSQAENIMDRASVYRTVELFEQIGIVHRINIGWKYKLELSDKFAEHHHHLTCLKCKQVIPINEDELEHFITKVAAAYSFQPLEHQVEIQGYCKNCRPQLAQKTA
jgi:Fur family ferric uptake transcriptional regulator